MCIYTFICVVMYILNTLNLFQPPNMVVVKGLTL